MPYEYLPAPLFMMFAAAYAERYTRATVVIRDSIARRESDRSFLRFVQEGRFDYIFVESASPSWPWDREWIRRLHQTSPSSRIVVCGSIVPERCDEILSELPVHACVLGEYEKGAVEVLEGRCGRVDYSLLSTDEMNRAPWPKYDERVATAYYDRNPRGGRRPQAQVWGSRGCPYRCIFCLWPATMTGHDPDGRGWRRVRFYDPAYVEGMLRSFVARYGFRSVYFDDDTFNLGDRHTRGISEVMRKLGLPWSAMCRTDTISMETWELMRRCGCYGVKVGFESGCQEVIDRIVRKSLDLAHAAEVVRYLKRLGFTVHGTFTIGLPGETKDQMRKTLEFAASLPLDPLQISGTAVLEGTPLHRLLRDGRRPSHEENQDREFEMYSDGQRKYERLIRRLERADDA